MFGRGVFASDNIFQNYAPEIPDYLSLQSVTRHDTHELIILTSVTPLIGELIRLMRLARSVSSFYPQCGMHLPPEAVRSVEEMTTT